MDKNLYSELLKETNYFFNNIFTSKELQDEYDLLRNDNGWIVLNELQLFKNNRNHSLTKPFYENNYKNEDVPRVLNIRRNEDGFIICSFIGDTEFPPYPIEPRVLVSIIFQAIEDEAIKKEMYQTKEKEKDYSDMEL